MAVVATTAPAPEQARPASPVPESLPTIDQSREIRVLELLPGKLNAPIRCRIWVHALDRTEELLADLSATSATTGETGQISSEDAPAEPKRSQARRIAYEALSYTWGSTYDSRTMQLDGTPIDITKNLWKALRRLRRRVRSRYVWVDQICINQANTNERNHQVRLMKHIYSQAAKVLIWLGDWDVTSSHQMPEPPAPPEPPGEPAVDPESVEVHVESVIESLEKSRPRTKPTDKIALRFRQLAGRRSERLMLDYTARSVLDTWPAWSERGWVVQEAVLATAEPVICFHDIEVPARDFISLENTSSSEYIQRIRLILKYRDLPEERRTLVQLLHVLHTTKVSDPRDKVYSLLGIIAPLESRLITPDYAADVKQVYQQATHASIIARDSLGILSMIPERLNTDLEYPSWVVDFEMKDVARLAKRMYEPGVTKDTARRRRLQATARDLGYFAFIPRLWCPQQKSRSATVSLDAEAGTLKVLGLKFDVMEHTVCFADVHDIETAAIGSLELPVPQDSSADRPQPIEAMSAKRWEATSIAGKKAVTTESHKGGTTVPKAFHHWLQLHGRGMPSSDNQSALIRPWSMYFMAAGADPRVANCLVSRHRFVGMALSQTRPGDVIALLYGAPAPVILRAREDGTWRFLGFAYIHGIMAHELMDTPELKFEECDFVLS